MTLSHIVAGDYGQVLTLTVTDVDTEVAADISTYAVSQQMQFKNPSGSIVTRTAAFVTDGTDGLIKYTTVVADFPVPGTWHIRCVLTSSGARLCSAWVEFDVEPYA